MTTTSLPPGWGGLLLSLLGALAIGCGPTSGPRTDSQTNWLTGCKDDADCGGLSCLCGACTRSCDEQAGCNTLTDASCVLANDAITVAFCDGQLPPGPGLCLLTCEDDECGEGQACEAGACTALPESKIRVTIDPSVHHQALIGLGATLAYAEDQVAQYSNNVELMDAMFGGLGLDMLRLRNHYGYDGEEDLTVAAEVLAAAEASLGHPPVLMLSSWSPPPALKASGELKCAGNEDPLCTLITTTDGQFDYEGFATHWRASLEAYAEVGVVPDYIGLQNNPDFVPEADDPASAGEGCRFLPVEGTDTLTVDGESVEVQFPGFAEALDAVVAQLADLPSPPRIAAPETSTAISTPDYVSQLDVESTDAIAHHLYGTDPTAVETRWLTAAGELASSLDLPVLQTAMRSDGLGTAVLAHHALVTEGVSAYLQQVLVGPAADVDPERLVSLSASGITLEDPYYALRHYALHTDPGWVRVDATSESDDLLASAWLAPEGGAVTVVLVNASDTALDVGLVLDELDSMTSDVSRTVFDGVERSSELGPLSSEGVLRVPGQAIVTVTLQP